MRKEKERVACAYADSLVANSKLQFALEHETHFFALVLKKALRRRACGNMMNIGF
jgi:hypothetical protein